MIFNGEDVRSIADILAAAEQRLIDAGVGEPRRNCEILLEHVLNLDRNDLILSRAKNITQREMDIYEELLIRHENGEPVQQITGSAPFFGYDFIVGKGVFVPRFDSEALVERVLSVIDSELADSETINLLDLCCGCGTIGLTVAAERENVTVTLIDSSPIAIEYAKKNAVALTVQNRVTVVQMSALDLFPSACSKQFHIVTANPPYIPADQVNNLPKDVRDGDPLAALTDDGEGFSFYRRFMETVSPILQDGGYLFVECGDGGAENVRHILSEWFTAIRITKDLNGIDRVVEGGFEVGLS